MSREVLRSLVVQSGGGAPGRPATTAFRVAFVVIATISLVLGYFGFGAFLRHSTDYGNRPIDLFYYDIQLFVLGADPLQQTRGPYPLLLEIARFAAPAVTAYALFEAARLLFAVEVARARARLSRGHVVVCGDGPIADTLARRLSAAGQTVIAVRRLSAEVFDQAAARRMTVVGDARDPDVLRAAGVAHATALYACIDSGGAANTAVAFAAGRIRPPGGPPLAAFVHVGDPELCLTLQARYLGLEEHPTGLRLDFFNVDDVAARKLITDEGLAPVGGAPPRIVIAGATAFGRAVLAEAVRGWKGYALDIREPVTVSVVGLEASRMVAEFSRRYPSLRTACRLEAHDTDLAEALVAGRLREPPDRVFICYDDEEYALKLATVADRFWRSVQSIVVRLDQLAAFQGDPDGRLFGEVTDRVHVFGVVAAACDPTLIGEDLVGRLARVIHDRYRQARHSLGETVETNPSLVRWEDLPPYLYESNRAQARDIGRKLNRMRWVLTPRVVADERGELMVEQIDRLAQMEHERWLASREDDGWTYGAQIDHAHKRHPGICGWHDLPDALRRPNRDAMQELPAILSDAGFQIVAR